MSKQFSVVSWNGDRRPGPLFHGSDDYVPTNLDHVIVSDNMDIRDQQGAKKNVTVLGWPKLPEAGWDSWFTEYSDHGMLYFEVW
jgi:hypothetical protein